jgi:hypothetical protein
MARRARSSTGAPGVSAGRRAAGRGRARVPPPREPWGRRGATGPSARDGSSRGSRSGRRERGNRGGSRAAPPAVPAGLEFWIRAVEDLGRYAEAVSRELRRLGAGGTDPTEAARRLAALAQEYLRSLVELPVALAAGRPHAGRPSARPRRGGRVID